MESNLYQMAKKLYETMSREVGGDDCKIKPFAMQPALVQRAWMAVAKEASKSIGAVGTDTWTPEEILAREG